MRFIPVYLLLFLLLPSPAMADGPTWKAGTAKAVITPEAPMYLAGYGGRDQAATGTLHDIWVKVLALEDAEGRRGVIITTDVCGVSRAAFEAVTEEAEKRYGLDKSQVLLCYSHTHTGPALRECLQDYCDWNEEERGRILEYSLRLEKTIVEKIGEALEDLGPATLEATEGRAEFAVNRRENTEAEVPKMRAEGTPLKGPVDHDVPILAVKDAGGNLKAIFFGYACHATTLATTEWSGDFCGFAQIELEKNHPTATALYNMTCGADINPIPRRDIELCKKYGHELAQGVEKALAGKMRPVEPRLRTAFTYVSLDYDAVLTEEQLKEAAKLSHVYDRWARRMIEKLKQGETFDTSWPYAVQVWRLGESELWINLAGETVVDYSINLKRQFGPNTVVRGFCHELTAYIPSLRIWNEGGYEGGFLGEYGHPAMRWKPDVEQRITDAVAELVDQVK